MDVTLDEPLPPGARPDQSVDGVIELSGSRTCCSSRARRSARRTATITLFKVPPNRRGRADAGEARRRSVQFVEVVEGLQEGDRVVLSDMSQYDSFDRIRCEPMRLTPGRVGAGR